MGVAWQILGRDKWKNRAKTGKCSDFEGGFLPFVPEW